MNTTSPSSYLQDLLAAKGWKFTKSEVTVPGNVCNWIATKRTDGRDCESNLAPPLVVFSPCICEASPFFRRRLDQAELSIAGMAFGQWWELKVYGMSCADCVASIDTFVAALTRQWNALALDEAKG